MPRTARKQDRRKAVARKPRSVLGSLPDRIGPDQLAHLNEALHWLFGELRDAAEHHRSGDNGGRDGAFHAIKAVTAFLMLFRSVNKKGLQAPLALLANALTALDHNTVEPMMKPVPRPGRAPASSGRQSLKGVAAYVVRQLQDVGIDRTTACKDVAAQLVACDVRPDRGSGKITHRTIREWCDAISADVGRRGDDRQTFDGMLAGNKRLPRKKARQLLLARLASIARQTRAREMI